MANQAEIQALFRDAFQPLYQTAQNRTAIAAQQFALAQQQAERERQYQQQVRLQQMQQQFQSQQQANLLKGYEDRMREQLAAQAFQAENTRAAQIEEARIKQATEMKQYESQLKRVTQAEKERSLNNLADELGETVSPDESIDDALNRLRATKRSIQEENMQALADAEVEAGTKIAELNSRIEKEAMDNAIPQVYETFRSQLSGRGKTASEAINNGLKDPRIAASISAELQRVKAEEELDLRAKKYKGADVAIRNEYLKKESLFNRYPTMRRAAKSVDYQGPPEQPKDPFGLSNLIPKATQTTEQPKVSTETPVASYSPPVPKSFSEGGVVGMTAPYVAPVINAASAAPVAVMRGIGNVAGAAGTIGKEAVSNEYQTLFGMTPPEPVSDYDVIRGRMSFDPRYNNVIMPTSAAQPIPQLPYRMLSAGESRAEYADRMRRQFGLVP